MNTMHSFRVWMASAFLALAAVPAWASHIELLSITPSSTAPGATATYSIEFRIGGGNGNLPAGDPKIRITFPVGYNVAGASFDEPSSGVREAAVGAYNPFPTYNAFTVDAANRILLIDGINYGTTAGVTMFRVVYPGVANPAATGNYSINVTVLNAADAVNTNGSTNVSITVPPGVNLDVDPAAPVVYANEIIASTTAPVTLTNAGGILNLMTPLKYSFSADEVRYARVECTGNMRFDAGSAVSYLGGGSASLGAINGLGTQAIYFSITANDNGVVATDRLSISGNRSITAIADASCTYGLYDNPSEAATGGATGRIVMQAGSYIRFAPSYAFTATSRQSVASVEASPSYSSFVANAPTTTSTAALGRLTYALASPVPRKADGNPIALSDLHATGASGTRIVVQGDFGAARNADGSFTGDALSRVFLSATNGDCTVGGSLPANMLSAGQATFNVGATATDRMLCLMRRSGELIPASSYSSTLVAVSAAPTVYSVASIGPRSSGMVVRDGTELQAPLAQVPGGWLSRLVLTNTGSLARPYTIAVQGESGNTISTSNTTGTVPANSTIVVDLTNVLTGFTGAPRATLNVTVAGPNAEIQGLYQIVNPEQGGISNHAMVRPGTN